MGFRSGFARAGALAACAAACWLLLAGSASAQRDCGQNNVPPGNSEVDQYAETVPNGCGKDRPSGDDAGNPEAVSPGTATDLEQLGADGETALALARASAPDGGDANGDQGNAFAIEEGEDDGGIGDIVTGVVDAAGGSGTGLGLALPLILIAVCVAAGVYLSRRSST
jgi:hypothetical protein